MTYTIDEQETHIWYDPKLRKPLSKPTTSTISTTIYESSRMAEWNY